MEDLIKALLIFQKYIKPDDLAYNYPTACEHDELYVNVNPDIVSVEDKTTLYQLGFFPSEYDGDDEEQYIAPVEPEMEGDYFMSYRFGSWYENQ